MKRLILHIGPNKTGTTSIQSFLRTNHERLAQQGIHYPMSVDSHNQTIFSLIDTDKVRNIQKRVENLAQKEKDWREAWRRELSVEAGTTILSAEQLLSCSEQEIRSLKARLKDSFDEFILLCYVRDYDEYVLSDVQQRMKSGSLSIDAQLRSLLDNCDYSKVCRWIEACPEYQIRLRPFKPALFYQGDLVRDFFRTADLDSQLLAEYQTQHVNRSIGLYSVLFLERYNNRYPLMRGGRLNRERGLARQGIPVGPHITVADEPFRLDFGYSTDQAKKVNRWLAVINAYLPKEGRIPLRPENGGAGWLNLNRDIPKAYYCDIIQEYHRYLQQTIERSKTR